MPPWLLGASQKEHFQRPVRADVAPEPSQVRRVERGGEVRHETHGRAQEGADGLGRCLVLQEAARHRYRKLNLTGQL